MDLLGNHLESVELRIEYEPAKHLMRAKQVLPGERSPSSSWVNLSAVRRSRIRSPSSRKKARSFGFMLDGYGPNKHDVFK
jgi:hypothetical protein